jgi:hypothetical protein
MSRRSQQYLPVQRTGIGVSRAQPALSGLRNFIIQNRAGLIVFAAGMPLYTPPSKSQGIGRVFLASLRV